MIGPQGEEGKRGQRGDPGSVGPPGPLGERVSQHLASQCDFPLLQSMKKITLAKGFQSQYEIGYCWRGYIDSEKMANSQRPHLKTIWV